MEFMHYLFQQPDKIVPVLNRICFGLIDLPDSVPVDFLIFQTKSQVGNVTFDPLGSLNVGIQKQFSNNSRLSFNITDVLNSLKRTGKTNLASEEFFVNRTFDFSQRTFRLTYSLSFGSQNIKGTRNWDSAGEERERIN